MAEARDLAESANQTKAEWVEIARVEKPAEYRRRNSTAAA